MLQVTNTIRIVLWLGVTFCLALTDMFVPVCQHLSNSLNMTEQRTLWTFGTLPNINITAGALIPKIWILPARDATSHLTATGTKKNHLFRSVNHSRPIGRNNQYKKSLVTSADLN